jgi:hypothetical protein
VELLARCRPHGVLDLFPVAHRVAVDLDDAIARLEPGARGGTVLEDIADRGGG